MKLKGLGGCYKKKDPRGSREGAAVRAVAHFERRVCQLEERHQRCTAAKQ